MQVGDFMTRQVVAIPPETPALAVARLLADRGFSGVPVTDPGQHLLGVVSEADLIRRLATADPEAVTHGVLGHLFYDRDRAAARYARAHGATAADLMTRNVITATEATTAEHAAHLLDQHRIHRLPVLQGTQLVGIVSRADLLRALLVPATDTSDAAILAAVQAARAQLPWAQAPFVFLDVHDGVVGLHGYCDSAAVHRGLVALVRDTPGVTALQDSIVETTGNRWA